MLKTDKTILIEAPAEEVFAYATDPTHLPEYWTDMREVSDVKQLPSGGYSFKYEAKVAGLHFKGFTEDVEFTPNQRIVGKTTGGLEGTVTATFEAVDGKTRVHCVEEYTLPGGFLGRLGEPFLAKYFDHAAAMTQETMKARIEAGVPATTTR